MSKFINDLKLHKIFVLLFLMALGLRLWHITNPLLDEHSWRQTGSGMVARNYMANPNFFQPAVDFDYRYPMAYGLFEYLVGMAAKVVGYSDILGRSISLFTFLIGFIYFYKLVLRYFNKATALWASAYYGFLPVAVFYTRAFQPDGNMVSMGIVFLYYFAFWVDEGKWQHYILSIILANLAFLFKIPALMMLFPAFGYLVLKEGLASFYNWRWYLFVMLSTAFPFFFHYYVPIATKGLIQSALFEQDKWGGGPIWLNLEFWWKTFFMNLSEYHFMHAGYVLMIFGVFKKVQKKEQWLFYFWLGGVVLFFIAVAKGIHHEYYNLPILPIGSIFIGRFLADFFESYKKIEVPTAWNRAARYLIVFMVVYSVVFSLIRLNDRYKINNNYMALAQIVKANSQDGDHVIVMSRQEPEVLYYSHRKGVNAHTYEQLIQYLADPAPQYKVLAIAITEIRKESPKLYNSIRNSYNVVYDGEAGIVARLSKDKD